MDKLFDIFNSSKIPNRKQYNRSFKQTAHLNKMADTFRTLNVINKFKGSDETNRMNCINGWLISISGLQFLWTLLNPTKSQKYVYTNRLNQDCLENLFSTFR